MSQHCWSMSRYSSLLPCLWLCCGFVATFRPDLLLKFLPQHKFLMQRYSFLSCTTLLVLQHSSNSLSLCSVATKMFYVATFFNVSSTTLVIECRGIYIKCRDIVYCLQLSFMSRHGFQVSRHNFLPLSQFMSRHGCGMSQHIFQLFSWSCFIFFVTTYVSSVTT